MSTSVLGAAAEITQCMTIDVRLLPLNSKYVSEFGNGNASAWLLPDRPKRGLSLTDKGTDDCAG